ncbi:DUF89 domain-containing protein [Neolentinus lepideus HHB14362 ss-1]|uniref:Sugar phosphate phosphatase n=1 Tax=Neolentinus lepideus HHB14362 ss-1 TaxID=1314782 RepID=A0A165SBR4_9AGAM|nr:DUF89 domain-containing protein [Neolentinus lepideus HHB14362 ss-1]
MAFNPPYAPYDPTDKSGFSYETVVKRWPIILTGIIDHLYSLNHELSTDTSTDAQDKVEEGKAVIGKISALKYHMGRDHPLEKIPEDGEPHVDVYNAGLDDLEKQGKNTWFTTPWLFAECYLYRLLRSYFSTTKHWKQFDPFYKQKLDTFKKSGDACYQLATTMAEFESEKDVLASDPDKLKVVFGEMVQMCLWGNATDLSLLTHLSHDDIQKLQSVGKDAHAARKDYLLRDDGDKAWKALKKGGQEGRVDFVLDNAGFELFTDFVFADFLLTYTPYVKKVVFHPKMIPWFVSDVTPPDFAATIPALLDPSFFPDPSSSLSSSTATPASPQLKENLKTMVTRWQSYINSGVFALSVPEDRKLGEKDEKADFWTGPWPYWEMKMKGAAVWERLRGSGLVVFKGDLNYRKLTGDIRWPAHTTFEEAIGPLVGSFPILSLRTSKADVVVGVDKEVAQRLDESGEKWRVNGKYALISFAS